MGGVFNPYDDTELMVTVDTIEEDVNAIRAQTDSVAILSELSNEITTDGTEQTLWTEESPAGVFRPICLKLDFTNQTAGETVVIREYYRINPTGAMIMQSTTAFAGVQSPLLKKVDLDPNRFGVRVTIEKTAGANRDYDYEVFYEEAP